MMAPNMSDFCCMGRTVSAETSVQFPTRSIHGLQDRTGKGNLVSALAKWLAERYFRDDPGTAIFKLRQFAELLSKTIAAHHALYLGERETL